MGGADSRDKDPQRFFFLDTFTSFCRQIYLGLLFGQPHTADSSTSPLLQGMSGHQHCG